MEQFREEDLRSGKLTRNNTPPSEKGWRKELKSKLSMISKPEKSIKPILNPI